MVVSVSWMVSEIENHLFEVALLVCFRINLDIVVVEPAFLGWT